MTKFVILTECRSGFNFLATSLNRDPKVFCFGELFDHNKQVRQKCLFHKGINVDRIEDDEDPIPYLDRLYSPMASYTAVGFKLAYIHARKQNWKHLWNYVRDHRFPIIHLKRENLLNRYLSQELALRETNWSGKTYFSRIELRVEDLVLSFGRSYDWRADAEEFFRDSPMLEVWYEDLVSKPECLMEAQRFVGVEPDEKNRSRMIKQRQKLQSWHIKNYHEVYSYFLNELPECVPFLEDLPVL